MTKHATHKVCGNCDWFHLGDEEFDAKNPCNAGIECMDCELENDCLGGVIGICTLPTYKSISKHNQANWDIARQHESDLISVQLSNFPWRDLEVPEMVQWAEEGCKEWEERAE